MSSFYSRMTKGRINWAAIVGAWSLFGLWYGNQTFLDMHMRGMHHSYLRMVIWGWLVGLIWVPLTPPLLALAKLFPFEKRSLLRSIPLHICVYASLVVIVKAAKEMISIWMRPYDPIAVTGSFSDRFREGLFGAAATTLVIYVAFLGIAHALEYRRDAREKELQTAQLEALLSQAQVLSLKMQLHPHFLFNTLNGIVALVRDRENESAVKMLIGLSDMLRYALDSSGKQEVPLSEELDFLNLYLEIEQMRFSERLRVELDIDSDAKDALVPSLMLQPLAENAIRHGIAPRIAPGTVRIAAKRNGDELMLTIIDDGVGMKEGDGADAGIGLQNTKSRLQQLYPNAFDFQILNRPAGGVEVRVILPYRPAQRLVLV